MADDKMKCHLLLLHLRLEMYVCDCISVVTLFVLCISALVNISVYVLCLLYKKSVSPSLPGSLKYVYTIFGDE